MAFNNPIFIKWNETEQLIPNEQILITTNGIATLSQIPDSFKKVQIDGLVEIKQEKQITSENQFKVNYRTGYLTFHESKIGQIINVTKYYGLGVIHYPASRIYDSLTGEYLDTTKSLQDFLDSIKIIGWQGDYDNTALYFPNAIVYYPQEKTIYRCINLSKGNIPTNTTYWQAMISVKEETDYANSMANYAKQQGDLAKIATENANTATAEAVEATQNANTATTDANNITQKINNETLMIYKPYVTNYVDIATTYPTPQNGWTTVATSTNTRYRYNSTLSQWVNIDVAPYDKIGDLSQITQTNLVDGLKDKDNKIGILNSLNTQNKTDLVGAINETTASLNEKASQASLNVTNTNVANNTSQLNNLINPSEKLITLDDIASPSMNYTLESDGTILTGTITDVGKSNHIGFLSPLVKEITFQYLGDFWIILGGNLSNFTSINISPFHKGRILEGTQTTYSFIRDPQAIEDVQQYDLVNVKVDGNKYIFTKSHDGVNFIDWFVVDKRLINGGIGWNNNSNLGFMLNASQQIAKNIKLKTSNIMSAEYTAYSRYKGLKLNTLGDSITYFNVYQPILKDALQLAAINNYGVSGTCITAVDESDTQAFCVRYGSMDNTADCITVYGGINDYYTLGGKPLGTINDTSKYTFYGALRVLIEGITVNNPTSRLAFFTPIQCVDSVIGFNVNSLGFKLIDYVNAIKEICKLYGIPVLDLYGMSGINQINGTNFISDGVHPNQAGYNRISKLMISFLNSI